MFFLSIIHHYLLWHYSRAFLEIFRVWLNLLEFVWNFFSISTLLRSLFAPFKRISEGRGQTFSFEDFAGYIIINLISRLIGAVARVAIIVIGVVTLLCTTVGGFAVYFFWIAAPLAIFLLIAVGLSFLLA